MEKTKNRTEAVFGWFVQTGCVIKNVKKDQV